MRLLLAMGFLLAAAAAPAQQVYKWKDANGVTHYGDKPVGNNAAELADLPALQIYGLSNGKKATRSGAPYGGSGPHVEITQPLADALLAQAGGKFTVNVNVLPALAAGQSLNYYLDGELQNRAPTASTAFLYQGADKGDHMISVAVVDDAGRELSRSEPVIVHLQSAAGQPPPSASKAAPPPAPAAVSPPPPPLTKSLKEGV
ncbi:MAG TPA: DUF4124 domain-containing protein [Nevskiaceae bacterium]|nr:DUF4124 domain-containing protein [Nevskiaceae bacterium]